ncbi:type II secretion system protein N [Leucothrix sargassi]|nr:type II secretion system protein N [Leucothrix sargassi]
MKTFKLILLGCVTFLITAVILTPTAFVAPHINKAAPNITLANGSGTIWNGTAGNLRIDNIDLGRVSWKVRPIKSLTSLSLVTDFEIKGQELTAKGLGAFGMDRTIRLNDTTFEVAASFISRFQRSFRFAGDFQGLITSAELTPKEFPVVDGILNWAQGSLLSPIRLDPANYRAEIRSSKDTLTADISASDGPIDLSGLASINSNWEYEADVLAKAQNNVNPLIKNVLRNASGGTQPDADGSIRINRKGSIAPITLYE